MRNSNIEKNINKNENNMFYVENQETKKLTSYRNKNYYSDNDNYNDNYDNQSYNLSDNDINNENDINDINDFI
jgi:hypothetical protein